MFIVTILTVVALIHKHYFFATRIKKIEINTQLYKEIIIYYNKYMTRVYNTNDNNDNINQTTKICVEHIYNSIDISRFKYELLEFESKMSQLNEIKSALF